MNSLFAARHRALRRFAASFSFLAAVLDVDRAVTGEQAPASGLISISRSGIVYNRASGTFDVVLTLTKTSSAPLSSRVVIAVSNISSASVQLDSVAGFTTQAQP